MTLVALQAARNKVGSLRRDYFLEYASWQKRIGYSAYIQMPLRLMNNRQS